MTMPDEETAEALRKSLARAKAEEDQQLREQLDTEMQQRGQ